MQTLPFRVCRLLMNRYAMSGSPLPLPLGCKHVICTVNECMQYWKQLYTHTCTHSHTHTHNWNGLAHSQWQCDSSYADHRYYRSCKISHIVRNIQTYRIAWSQSRHTHAHAHAHYNEADKEISKLLLSAWVTMTQLVGVVTFLFGVRIEFALKTSFSTGLHTHPAQLNDGVHEVSWGGVKWRSGGRVVAAAAYVPELGTWSQPGTHNQGRQLPHKFLPICANSWQSKLV